jgi:hypothetical protein
MALAAITFTRKNEGDIFVSDIKYQKQSLNNECTKKKVQEFISKNCEFKKIALSDESQEINSITSSYTLTIYFDKVEFSDHIIDKAKFTCSLKNDQNKANKALLDSILKTDFVFELSHPSLTSQPQAKAAKQSENNTNLLSKISKKTAQLFNFCFIEETYLAKFCDVSKLLRWGFFALTFAVLLLAVYHFNFMPINTMSFIPSVYGIAIVGGVFSLIAGLNISKIIKNQKIKKNTETIKVQKKLCDKEIKKAILNIVFSATLLSLLAISIPILISAFHGVSVASLNNIGFSKATILFGTFNIAVGVFQLVQSIKNFFKANKNRNINKSYLETIKEFLKGSEFQSLLQIALNIMLIVTGIAAFIITNQQSSFVLAALIESTTILNIGFVFYNLKKLKNIKKEIKESNNFKNFLEKYFKLTKEEEEKVNEEVKKQYQNKKDFRRWANSNLSLKEKNKYFEYDDEKAKEFIKLFYYQKVIDKKRDLFQLLIGKKLCDKCTDAIKKDSEDLKTLEEEVLKAIDNRRWVEIQKFIAPVACLIAFSMMSLLTLAPILPFVASFLHLWPHYYLWILFIYAALQLAAKAIMTPKAYIKNHRNIPADEESVVNPTSVKDHLLALKA